MRRAAVGFAAALTVAFAGPAFAESDFDEIQDQELPGSEIGVEIGKGKVEVERENGSPIFPLAPYAGAEPLTQSIFPVAPLLRGAPSSQLKPLDDPDAPVAGDPIDRELPGEGPEDLSGPDDDNPPPE
jgi:hypothetical protein